MPMGASPPKDEFLPTVLWGSCPSPQGSWHQGMRFLMQSKAFCIPCISWMASRAGSWMLNGTRGPVGTCPAWSPAPWRSAPGADGIPRAA